MPGVHETTLTLTSAADGTELFVRTWRGGDRVRATVQILHGMGEHSGRYARLAGRLVAAGYAVVAHDHRGHGQSASLDTLGHFGTNGWEALVADAAQVGAWADIEFAAPARVVIGHSMGSFALQQYLLDHSELIAGAVLSATSAVDVLAGVVDPTQPADLTLFNDPFEPARTPYDWLSRDEAEVDLYVADERCGIGVDAQATADMMRSAPRLADPDALRSIRADLPVLLIAGTEDPLSANLALVELVASRYRDAGLADVDVKGYPEARHELFNEINRDEVTRDVLAWLDRVVV